MDSKNFTGLEDAYKLIYSESKKDESPEKEEEDRKKDDDLFGSPNKKNGKNGDDDKNGKNGKKKAKRWWDDDGDGKGYEKGEVKEDMNKGYVVTAADKKGNTPAYQGLKAGKKNVKTGKPLYKAADHLKDDKDWGYDKDGNSLNPVDIEKKKKKDDDLAGSPNVKKESYETKKKAEVLSAMKRQGRKLSDKDKEKIAAKVVKDKGDTSKSDDRYAYEELTHLRALVEKEVKVKDTRRTVDAIRAYDKSKDASRDATYDTDEGDKEKADIEKKYAAKERGEIDKDDPNWKKRKYHTGIHGEEVEALKRLVESGKFSDEEIETMAWEVYEALVAPKGVDSQKEVDKATRKAAFRPFKNTTPPKLKVAEDKAFDNVVGKLRKKYGKDAVLTKDSPKPKAQPRPKAKPDTRTPEQKKTDQDHANEMARDGCKGK